MKQNRHFIFTVVALLFGFALSAKAEDVAKIGTTSYATLAEVFSAVQDGETITLLSDLVIDTETYTVKDGVAVTLDMNGKKLTVTDNKNGSDTKANYELFYVLGELTVTGNGTIELTSTYDRNWNSMSTIFHNRGGVLTIENGTFKNLGGTDMAWVVDNSGNWSGDAVTNINGGTLYSSYTAIRNRMEKTDNSGKVYLYVTGGVIDGVTSAIWAQAASTSLTAPATGEINISGGEIGVVNTARSAGAECMTTISGGTVSSFKGEVGELTVTDEGKITGDVNMFTATGYAANFEVTADGQYKPVLVAEIGGKSYASLAETFDAAKNGETITLLSDLAVDEGIVIEKDRAVTLDLNGYALSMVIDEDVQIKKNNSFILNRGDLTITDGSQEGTGKISYEFKGTATGAYAVSTITNEQGTLTINGGTIENLTYWGNVTNFYPFTIDNITNGTQGDAVLNIAGGVITNRYYAIAVRGFSNSTTCENIISITSGEISGEVWLQDSNGSANKATMTITGGTISATSRYAIYLYGLGDASGMNVTIGGDVDVNGTVYLASVNTTKPFEASITGGDFDGDVWSYAWSNNNADYVAVSAISGGVFSKPVDESCFVDGYVPVQNPDGSYGASNSIIINDADYKTVGKTYDNSISMSRTVGEITYNRTFGHTSWQVLYVPFTIPYENFKDAFEAYTITGVENDCVTLTQITEGAIEANTPCLVRAHEEGEVTITVENAVVCATENNSFSFVDDAYTFTGTYSAMDADALKSGKCYVLSGGSWQQLADSNTTAVLGAFRVYLTISEATAARSFSMRVVGGNAEDGTTAIEQSPLAPQHEADVIYDLLGRRVTNLTQGIFIVNGKKVVIR